MCVIDVAQYFPDYSDLLNLILNGDRLVLLNNKECLFKQLLRMVKQQIWLKDLNLTETNLYAIDVENVQIEI